MSRLPSISYRQLVAALKRDGWMVVRQRGSHIRLEKETPERTHKLTVPAHSPLKTSTLRHILNQAGLDRARLLKVLR